MVKNLQQLIRVATHGGQDAAIFQLDADIFPAQIQIAQLHGAGQDAIEVQQLFFSGNLPRKTEQIVDQVLGTAGLLADFFSQRMRPGVRGVFDGEHVGITENRGERIIDFMRGARGQLAERSQFLGLHEMGLQPLDVFQRLPQFVHQAGALLVHKILAEKNKAGADENRHQRDNQAETLHRIRRGAEEHVPRGQYGRCQHTPHRQTRRPLRIALHGRLLRFRLKL